MTRVELVPLPTGTDPAEVGRIVMQAVRTVAERIAADPDSTRWLGRWGRAGPAGDPQMLPGLVNMVIPEDGSEPDLAHVLALARERSTIRARQHLGREHAVRIAAHSSREVLELVGAELGTRLDGDVLAAVTSRLAVGLDEYTAEYLVAFLDETATIAAEQEELSALLLDTTAAGFALGNPKGKISVANAAFVRFFGAAGDPVGRTWASVLGVDDTDEILRPEDGAGAWREFTTRDLLGEEHVVRVSMHGRPDRLQAIAVDVSLEAEFARLHREFVRGLIHDLRSPLAVISGWSHTLVADANRIGQEIRDEALGTINRAARQLTRMSDNLLELTLLEGGAHHLDLELLDAGARLRHMVDTGYAATVVGPEEVGVLADADAFERMVTNLLDNAVSHGRPPVTVRVVPVASHVCIEVVDQGEVDPALVADAERGRVVGARGFGLGLRTTLLLARAHGGDMRLASCAPTTFTLELPAPVGPG